MDMATALRDLGVTGSELTEAELDPPSSGSRPSTARHRPHLQQLDQQAYLRPETYARLSPAQRFLDVTAPV